MPTNDPSKYAENQFLSGTDRRYPLMSEVLADTLPRATKAAGSIAAIGPLLGTLSGVGGRGDGHRHGVGGAAGHDAGLQ